MSSEKLYLRDISNCKKLAVFDDIYTNMASSGLWFVWDEDEGIETSNILGFNEEYWYTYDEGEYEWYDDFAEAMALYEERKYYIDFLYKDGFQPSEYSDWNDDLKYWKKAIEFYDWCTKKGENYFDLLEAVGGDIFDMMAFIDEKMR